jgi:hypothetical protein
MTFFIISTHKQGKRKTTERHGVIHGGHGEEDSGMVKDSVAFSLTFKKPVAIYDHFCHTGNITHPL